MERNNTPELDTLVGTQASLFPQEPVALPVTDHTSSTFTDNMKLPVHRWFRFSAGFSASWAESVIADAKQQGPTRVFDPFAGAGTTLIAAENVGVESYGLDAHPFLCRVTRAKLSRRSDPEAYWNFIKRVRRAAARATPQIARYPALIRKCYDDDSLRQLDLLRQALSHLADSSPEAELAWLTLIGILRKVSRVGTAPWQYVLPRKAKRRPFAALPAFDELARVIHNDMVLSGHLKGPRARFLQGDARSCDGIPDEFSTLVVTSPPYTNNFDYADATRLEMTFMGEIDSWGDLHDAVRKHLIRACSQHVPERAVRLETVLASELLAPIRREISPLCRDLAQARLTHGGKKTYHLMVACYFLDLGLVWRALRRVCASPSRVCFVVGDSAPYGVYVPVIEWLGQLAIAAGFNDFHFERTRDRNVKWKNRKHRVPLCEGRLWVQG